MQPTRLWGSRAGHPHITETIDGAPRNNMIKGGMKIERETIKFITLFSC